LFGIKVAVNQFHFLRSFDRKESAQFVSHLLQIPIENEIQFFAYEIIHLIFLPFNLVTKSATANLVLLNSVLVDAKFVFVVSKSFEVAEPFHSI
jgi:hypothetical protein